MVVFFSGYAVFLTNWNIQLTATGIANRTAVAAALGVAVVAVTVFALAARALPSSVLRSATFAALVAAAASSGAFVNAVTAQFWVAADAEAQQILGALEAALPNPEPGTTILLDGTCRYHGPAVVFESNWDLAHALYLRGVDPSVRVDVVKPDVEVHPSSIGVSLYDQETQYPFRDGIVVFNSRDGSVNPLPDAAAARRYFAGPGAESIADCPFGLAGRGVRVF